MLGKYLKQIVEALQLTNTHDEAFLHMTSLHHEEFLDFQKQCYQQQQDWIEWAKQVRKEDVITRAVQEAQRQAYEESPSILGAALLAQENKDKEKPQ